MSRLYEDNPERHLFLYAKGWYKRNEQLDDLKKIVAHITVIPFESVKEYDLANWLTECVKMIIINNPRKLDLLLDKWWINRGFINSMLDIMSVASRDEIGFDLGKPDKNILPLENEK
jgi:hypothetical protein